jgi:hypothetical protein
MICNTIDATLSTRWRTGLASLAAVLAIGVGSILAAKSQAGRDTPKSKLRYTLAIKTAINKADGPLPMDPQVPEIELDGDLRLTAKLHNDGDTPVRVYWGDYAEPKMYRFEVTHESGWKPPVTRWWPDEHLPRAASEKYFVVIEPGQAATYDLLLTPKPGANCEHCYFNRPGLYTIKSSLFVVTDQILDEATGDTHAVPGAWTGALEAPSLVLKVAGERQILDEGVTIRGQVVDATGQPVRGALVAAQHRVPSVQTTGGFAMRELAQDLTDADGRFEFFHLPEESPAFELHVRHPEFLPNDDTVVNDASAGKRRSYETNITLDAGRTVRGRVVDSQGKPLADVRFTVGVQHYVYSNDQGHFTLTGLPLQGQTNVSVWKRGFADPRLTVPPADAAKESWGITLRRESEQTISGKAVFVSGEPLRNMQLVFDIEVRNEVARKAGLKSWVREAKTDAHGDFALVLPEPVESDVRGVTACAPVDRHLPTKIWRTSLGKIPVPQRGVNLVFDDTHSLFVRVVPVKPVPETFQLRVQYESLTDSRLVGECTLDYQGGAAEIKNLGPGKYRVTVAVMPHGSVTTFQDVEIAADADPKVKPANTHDARLTFNFPHLRFGRLIGQVVTPDGKPATDARIQIQFGRQGTSGIQVLDSDARFEFEQLPVGTAWLSPRLAGYDDRPTHAEVSEGETEVVKVVLKPLSEVIGTVAGRIVYEDGSPALGAGIGAFRPEQVNVEGAYEVQVRKDQPTFSINLQNADGWPRSDKRQRQQRAFGPDELPDTLSVTVPVIPGKTIPRDIVLDRKKLGRLTVRWKGPPTEFQIQVSVVPFQFAKAVPGAPKPDPLAPGQEVLDEQLIYSRSLWLKSEKDGTVEIPDLPRGRRTVSLRALRFSSYRFHAIPADQTDAEVTFDSDEDGALRFRLLNATGIVQPKAMFELQMMVPGEKQTLGFWSSPELRLDRESDDALRPSPFAQQDGSFLIEHLQPGQYELKVHEGRRSKTVTVEVKRRETTAVDVRIEELKADPNK